MKNLSNALIIIAIVSIILALISRIMMLPMFGMEARTMAGFAAVLLLLSIALSLKK